MPRKPMCKQNGVQLMDNLSLGAVMEVYPRKNIEAVLNETLTNSIRRRLLPAFAVVYLVIVLALYSEVSIRENLRTILEALRSSFGKENIKVAGGTAITKQRKRIGKAPFQRLFASSVRPIATQKLAGCYFAKWRVVAADGNFMEVQNTPENQLHFGVHKNQHGYAGYPQIKWAALSECGTHVVFAASTGGEHDSEATLFEPLIDCLKPDMLLLADRHYYRFDHWKSCDSRGSALLWRVRKSIKLEPIKLFEDGSFLAEVRPSYRLTGRGVCKKGEKMTVRVIEYKVMYEDENESEPIRLITNLLDPALAASEELAGLYAERWNIESGFDEIKTHLKSLPQKIKK